MSIKTRLKDITVNYKKTLDKIRKELEIEIKNIKQTRQEQKDELNR